MTDILAHGAVFDGNPGNAASNTAAWMAAIDVAKASDLTIECPAGTCVVADGDLDNAAIKIKCAPIAVHGKHRDATIIQLAPGENSHVFSLKRMTGGGLFDISVDGDRDNNTLGHCIRGEDVERLTIARVMARNAPHYGVGMQAGAIIDLTCDDLIIEDTGGDGIDFKNSQSANKGNVLRLIRVRRHGLTSSDQAGIDVRGPALLSDIIVEEFGDVQSGVRFRHGETTDANGLGAHGSIMTRFRIVGSSKTATLGVSCVARDVSIGYGYIEGVLRAVQAQAEMFFAGPVVAHDCTDGGYAAGPAGDDATFGFFRVTGATKGLRSNRPRTEIAASLAKGCGTSIHADATGTQMRVTGSRSVGPTGAHKGGTVANITATGLLEA